MRVDSDNAKETARALERQLEIEAEAAKRAIRDYKKAILQTADSRGERKIEGQREVERAVNRYMQVRKKLEDFARR